MGVGMGGWVGGGVRACVCAFTCAVRPASPGAPSIYVVVIPEISNSCHGQLDAPHIYRKCREVGIRPRGIWYLWGASIKNFFFTVLALGPGFRPIIIYKTHTYFKQLKWVIYIR